MRGVGRTRQQGGRMRPVCDTRWLLVLAMAVSTSPIFGDSSDTSIDVKAVRGLISSTDVVTLDRRFAKMDGTDPALVAVYRRRRLDLHLTAQEEVKFLESLPTTQADLSRVYTLTDSRDLSGEPYVTEVVY